MSRAEAWSREGGGEGATQLPLPRPSHCNHGHVLFTVHLTGCMSGLVRYLDNPAVEVASRAARTIWLLSSSPSNKAALLAQPGLFDKLVSSTHVPAVFSTSLYSNC